MAIFGGMVLIWLVLFIGVSVLAAVVESTAKKHDSEEDE